MTHTRNTPASSAPELDRSRPTAAASTDGGAADRDERAERALSEAMTVRPLADGRHVVETDGGTYVVALEAGSCTCPDHAIRGVRCKHLRRVALSVTAGSVPAPGERVGACAVCGTETFVSADGAGSYLCDRHDFDAGEVVRDRETGERVVVTAVTTDRADESRTDEGRPVAAYESNAAYGAHEPVVEAVYAESIRPDHPVDAGDAYGFPASRLTRSR